MQYPYKIEREENGGYILQLVDVPEVISYGETLEKAKTELLSAFISFAEWLFDDELPIPLPSSTRYEAIDIPTSTAVKIRLLNAMTETKTRPVDIGDKIGITRQEMTHIINLRRKTQIDTLEHAIKATGKTLRFSVS